MTDEVGSRKTDGMEGILGKGIRPVEGRKEFEAKGKTFS